jgi:hypothetical protein
LNMKNVKDVDHEMLNVLIARYWMFWSRDC